MEVLLLFSFYLRRLPVVLLPLLMPSLRQWFRFRKCIHVFLCRLWINGLDYWLGINHGICNWEYHGSHILEWLLYGTIDSGGIHLPQWVQMDYLTASTGYRDATALMQGGKQYENLSEGLKLSYTAWTTSPAIGSFHWFTGPIYYHFDYGLSLSRNERIPKRQ
jgi:hypothetical protein